MLRAAQKGYLIHVPPNKVTAHDVTHRHRLGGSAEKPDHWFVFGKASYEPNSSIVEPEQHYARIAQDVLTVFEKQASVFWGDGT